jgi:hypothetical protein
VEVRAAARVAGQRCGGRGWRGGAGGCRRGWRSSRRGRTHRGGGRHVEELIGQGRREEDEGGPVFLLTCNGSRVGGGVLIISLLSFPLMVHQGGYLWCGMILSFLGWM